jgi:hypothetical protein
MVAVFYHDAEGKRRRVSGMQPGNPYIRNSEMDLNNIYLYGVPDGKSIFYYIYFDRLF